MTPEKKSAATAQRDSHVRRDDFERATNHDECAHGHCRSGEGVKPIVEGDIIRTDETTVLGGDDKSGCAVIIESDSLPARAEHSAHAHRSDLFYL